MMLYSLSLDDVCPPPLSSTFHLLSASAPFPPPSSQILATYFDQDLHGDDKCFDVKATLQSGCWILFIATVFLIMARNAVMHLCHMAITEQDDEAGEDEIDEHCHDFPPTPVSAASASSASSAAASKALLGDNTAALTARQRRLAWSHCAVWLTKRVLVEGGLVEVFARHPEPRARSRPATPQPATLPTAASHRGAV